MSTIAHAVVLQAAEESGEEVNRVLSYGIGIGILVLLIALVAALAAFGGGREHS